MIYEIIVLSCIFFLGIALILKGTDTRSKSRITRISGGLVSLTSWCLMMTIFI